MKATLLPSAARQTTPPPTAAPARKAAAPEPTGLPPDALAAWQADLQRRLDRVHQHPEQGLGFIEEQVRHSALELQRQLVERALQAKADTVANHCPACQRALTDKKHRVAKTIQSYCGALRLHRTHGWCAHCDHWVFPADAALGLGPDSTASPLVQELCALLVTKMPAEQAEAITPRLLGRLLSRSTLAREARRQGDRAIAARQQLTTQKIFTPPAKQGGPAVPPPAGLDQPLKAFTLIIQIDAWNIRERDHWGETQTRRAAGTEPGRWHWVYTGTCFHLDQRITTGGKRRAVITERSYVATRGGIEPLMQQLHYEAQVRGLATAERVLVIADGAVWIWNAVADRFGMAVQRLDLYHANTYLWAVANHRHSTDPKAARHWVKPLLRQLRTDQVARVITHLTELTPTLNTAAAKAATTAVEYYQNNLARMAYVAGEARHEPLGSGVIEATCHQLQVRMKRTGQFWSTAGDEALLALEICWRNDRWEHRFPHVVLTSATQN